MPYNPKLMKVQLHFMAYLSILLLHYLLPGRIIESNKYATIMFFIDNKTTEKLRKDTLDKSKLWPVYRTRLNNMQAQHRNELATQDNKNQQVKQHHDHLKGRTKDRIIQLKNCVFPIQEIDPQSKSQSFQKE